MLLVLIVGAAALSYNVISGTDGGTKGLMAIMATAAVGGILSIWATSWTPVVLLSGAITLGYRMFAWESYAGSLKLVNEVHPRISDPLRDAVNERLLQQYELFFALFLVAAILGFIRPRRGLIFGGAVGAIAVIFQFLNWDKLDFSWLIVQFAAAGAMASVGASLALWDKEGRKLRVPAFMVAGLIAGLVFARYGIVYDEAHKVQLKEGGSKGLRGASVKEG
ncbi:MAG: hypothetical protein JSS72_12145 [Armatimonadetes bacterium]|nr:hypothetical protein [Armatimonadota bacterium]